MSQNSPLVLVGFYQNLHHHAAKAMFSIIMSSVFRTKNLQDTGIDKVFFLEKSRRKMYTIYSAVQRQQRKSDVMTSFGLAACSAVYYQVPHCRFLINKSPTLYFGQFQNVNNMFSVQSPDKTQQIVHLSSRLRTATNAGHEWPSIV
jgi:hypothetical protein